MQTSFTVEGMTCQHCATSVSEEISEIPTVTGVEVDVPTGVVVVSSNSPLDDSVVASAVEEAGYRLSQ